MVFIMETTREKKVNSDISIKDSIDRKAIKLKKTVELSSSAKDVNKMVDSLEKGVIVLRNKVNNIMQQKQSQGNDIERNMNKQKNIVQICTNINSLPDKNKDSGRTL